MIRRGKAWLSREPGYPKVYKLWSTRPRFYCGEFYNSEESCAFLGAFWSEIWEKFTGIRLKPGECKQVEIAVQFTRKGE